MNDEPSPIADQHAAHALNGGTRPPDRAPVSAPVPVRFADFEFDPRRDELRKDGARIALRPKPLALLRYFLDHPQRLIAKKELLHAVWGASVVTDDSLVQCVGELRGAMGPEGAGLIVTHARRGYMFDVEVFAVESNHAIEPVTPRVPSSTQSPPTDPAPEGKTHRPRPRWLLASGAAVLLVACAVALFMARGGAAEHIDQELARRHAIGIQTFSDLGDPAVPAAFRQGLTEEIGAQIAANAAMLAIRGASSFPDPVGPRPDIVEAVGKTRARYLLGGSLTRQGGDLVVRAQLTAVDDARVLWAERYDFRMGETDRAADIQASAARRIAAAVWLRLQEQHKARVSAPGYRMDGADLALAAWYDLSQRQSNEDVKRSRRYFEEALKRDPQSAFALLGLGAVLMSERFGYNGEPPPKDVAESERVAELAVRMAPNDAVALILWGNVLLFRDQADQALPVFEKAARVAPTNANTHMRLAAVLLFNGRLADARQSIDKAMALSERDARMTAACYYLLSKAAFEEGDDASAYAFAQRSIADRPSYGLSYLTLAALDALHGRDADAARNLALHLKTQPQSTVRRFLVNNPVAHPQARMARERMIAGMRKAGLPE